MPRTVYDFCCWVLDSGKTCNKPTRYRMVRDDDGRLVRKYESLCSEHQTKSKLYADKDWEE